MLEHPAPISGETIRQQTAPVSIPPLALARWASMAANLSTTGVIPSQPAA